MFPARLVCSLFLVFGLVACTKDVNSRSASSESEGEVVVDDGSRFSSDCGTLVDGEMQNPVKKGEAVQITGSVANPYTLAVNFPEGKALVKLAALTDVEYFRDDAAMSFLANKISGNLYYYESQKDCTDYVSGGGQAFVGQVYNERGENISEELIKAGFAKIDTYDDCASQELISCYQALEDTAVQIGGNVSNFLWKPASDKNGNLVVLLNPYDATIVVNGETLVDSGPGNGRGTQGRGKKPGCAYGSNVTVKAYDSQGRVLLFPGARESYTVKDGCKRTEFK